MRQDLVCHTYFNVLDLGVLGLALGPTMLFLFLFLPVLHGC